MLSTNKLAEDGADRVRLAVVQYELRKIADFDEFAQQCSLFVKTAAAYESDFVLFPELLTTQLLSYMEAEPSSISKHLSAITDRYVELFSELARSTRTYVIAGSHLCEENGKLYNCSYFFDRDGNPAKQYKLHITPHERTAWAVEPGQAVEVFETDRGKIAILICYDIEFPELSRVAVQKGANIIFCPSNTDQRFGYLRVRYCAQARAIENQIYVAVSGCTGNTPMLGGGEIHYAQSAIFTPSDLSFAQEAVAAECAANVETMIIQDVYLSLLERNRRVGAVRPWYDRRSELYQVLYHGPDGEQLV
jgi:predicted amidohydrolase